MGFSLEEAKDIISKKQQRGLSFFIKKYGEEEGMKRYKKHCFLKSHSLACYVEKFGKEKGKQLYMEWRNNRKGMGNLTYYIKKYGEEKGQCVWETISKNKIICEEKYIELYGEEGKKKYHDMVLYRNKKIHCINSKPEIQLAKIVEQWGIDEVYYGVNSFVVGLGYDEFLKVGYRSIKPDIVLKNHKIIIEFYGDLFHGNPEKFRSTDKPNPWSTTTAKDLWKRDSERQTILEKKGFTVFVVWENDWKRDKNKVLKNLEEKIKVITQEKYNEIKKETRI